MGENGEYPEYDSDAFNHILNKYEFASNNANSKKSFIYQEPGQLLLRNYISKVTPYENILLYHGLGVGKTCASISIAEGFREYVTNLGRKIVVLVKNKNLQRNFTNELVSQCTKNDYLSDKERDLYFGRTIASSSNRSLDIKNQRRELVNQVHKTINKNYQFLTYGTFVNRVLGAKEFEKDEFGRNTNKVKRVDGKIQRKRIKNGIVNLSNTVIIVDEAHNVTNNDIYIALKQVLSRSYNTRLILLSATPIYDNPKEIFELSNLINYNNDRLQLPIRNDLFKPVDNTQLASGKVLVTKENSEYINNKVLKGGIVSVTDAGIEALKSTFKGKVSYLKANTETNPQTRIAGNQLIHNRKGSSQVVYCKMSKAQYITYLEALKQDIKSDAKFDISSAIQNLEAAENASEITSVSQTSSLYKNSSDASTMTYPNKEFGKTGFLSVFEKQRGGYTIRPEFKSVISLDGDLKIYSSKLHNLLSNINESPGNVFVYSNYVSFGGTTLLRLVLSANGYTEYSSRNPSDYTSFVVFDEGTNIETREKYRRIFNSPENRDGKLIKIIIGSPIISEGITLKNVRQVHILEPSWNMSRINQIIGRAVRNYSHQDLPPEDRNVRIFKYVSIYIAKNETIETLSSDSATMSLLKFFIDREKYVLSEEKDRSNKKVERILKEISFDCQLMKSRNRQDPSLAGTADCDYTECDFGCKVSQTDTDKLDKTTYNIGLQYFEKYDIEFVLSNLRELFRTYFIWSLEDIKTFIREQEPKVSDESIYFTLGQITSNKTTFMDMYGRDGFIINRGDFYIFNSTDTDIASSVYNKFLDFTVDTNKFTLEQFVKQKYNKSLFKPQEKEKKKKERLEEEELPEQDIQFNDNIVRQNVIFGTFRQRGTKEQPYGPADDKFRIVDIRKTKQESEDARKIISGMWIGSYKKPQLVDIAKYLNIKTKLGIEEYDKEQLGKLIERYLTERNLVLR